MSRQIKAKDLMAKMSQPFGVAESSPRHIPCFKCRSKRGAGGVAQSIKHVRITMSQHGFAEISQNSTGIVDDSLSILTAMGVGVVDTFPIQSNPRNPVTTTLKMNRSFSLLKVETDKMTIPNANIIDVKSRILKRGETKLISASEFVPALEIANSAMLKPDDIGSRAQIKNMRDRRDNAQKKNCSQLAKAIIKQQRNLPVQYMDPTFKLITRKAGT